MNQLLSDLHLKAQKALMEDRRTREYGIDILEQNGVITLKGSVPSPEIREAAEDVATAVFGVKGVINELEVDTINETRNR